MPNTKHKTVLRHDEADNDNIRQLVKYIIDNNTESNSVAGITNVIVRDDDQVITLRIMDIGYTIIYEHVNVSVVEYHNVKVDRSKYGFFKSNQDKD